MLTTVNSNISDNGVAGGLSLVLDSMSEAAGAITLANANTYTGTTFINGTVVNLANTTGSGFAVSGTSLIIDGGNNAGTDSLPQANATMFNLAAGQVNTAATVTIRNGAAWNLNGFASTITSLDFNSTGGDNGGNGPSVFTGSGTLTLTGGITSTNLTDVRGVPSILGLLSLPATESITVDPVSGGTVNGNGQIGLAINSNITSGGTINVSGGGVLELGGVSYAINQPSM